MPETVKVEAEITAELSSELNKLIKLGIYRNKDEVIMDGIRQVLERIRHLTKEEKAIIEDVKWGLRSENLRQDGRSAV